MGDLSGKLRTLELDPLATDPHKTYSFYDENLHLLGPFTGEFRVKNIISFTLLPSYNYYYIPERVKMSTRLAKVL